MQMVSLQETVLAAVVGGALGWAAGCVPDEKQGTDPADDPAPRTSFAWKQLDIGTPDATWGSFAVERENDTLLLGGVSASNASVVKTGVALTPGDDTVTMAADLPMDRERYCHCAMFDAQNNELVVLGGRNLFFNDATTAAVIDLDTGASETLVDAGAAAHPVGCQTFFFPALGRGYVFGGLSSTNGTFTDQTFRYDAATHTFSALEIEGPPKRYDAATHVLDDGTGLLVGGMGRSGLGVVLYADLWRFDPVAETWTEIPANNAVPQGRRYPWTAVSPDESSVVFGYGSDSGMGTTVLGDLWVFSLVDGTWSELALDGAPSARGFTYRWKGTPEMAGVLGFGYDGQNALADAWALLVPADQVGRWH